MIVETHIGPVSLDRIGDGPDLVMLHSLLSDKHIYDKIVPELRTSWRVNLVDLPGFGETARTNADIDSYADVIGALLDAGGYDPAHTVLVGNGLGAFVALGTAIRHGGSFHKLILAGCGSSFPEDARQQFPAMAAKARSGGMEAVVDVAMLRIFTSGFAESHPELVEERRKVLLQTDPEAFATACDALYKLDYDDLVSGVVNPVLLVVGSEDTPTPPTMSQRLHSLLPNSDYVELPGVAHAPQVQDPHGFLAAIEGFLAA